MSQDTSSKPNTPQEIDLDDLEVEILIIAKNANGMNQAANFLSRRGWPATVLTNVGKAIEYISDKQPDFILISFNHTHPAVLKLPELITRTFNLTVVGYAEVMDSVTAARLNNFKMQHKLQGQPSGPSIQRAIRKILAEKFNFKNSDEAESSEESGGKDQSEMIQGGNSSAQAGSGLIYQKGNAGAAGNDSKTQAVESPTGKTSTAVNAVSSSTSSSDSSPSSAGPTSGVVSVESEVVSSGKYTLKNKKARLSLKKATGMEGLGQEAQVDAGRLLSQALAQDGASVSEAEEGETGSPSRSSAEEQRSTQGKSLKDALAAQNQNGFASNDPTFSAATYPEAVSREGATESHAASGDRGRGPSVIGSENGLKTALVLPTDQEPTASSGAKSLMHATVESALMSVCVDSGTTSHLSRVERVCVFPVDSQSEPGYLVVGWNGQQDQDGFLKACELALKQSFSENGVPAQIENGFWVTVPDVKFWKWVNAKAKFFFALSHQGEQVGASFFSIGSQLPKARELEESGMYTIDLDHIATDQPVNFKAYLHMQKNKKYFLYLRDGRQLAPEQKERLKTNQVTNLSLKRVDVEKLRMFLAASYLRETIKGSSDEAA